MVVCINLNSPIAPLFDMRGYIYATPNCIKNASLWMSTSVFGIESQAATEGERVFLDENYFFISYIKNYINLT